MHCFNSEESRVRDFSQFCFGKYLLKSVGIPIAIENLIIKEAGQLGNNVEHPVRWKRKEIHIWIK